MDITTIDVSSQSVNITPEFINNEELSELDDLLRNQYVDFNNLGVNYFDHINPSESVKIILYQNMLDYLNENYLPIVDFDNVMTSNVKLLEVGDIVYKFTCVDCFNTIIPKFINDLGCSNMDYFDGMIRSKFSSNYGLVKASLLKCVKTSAEEILKLQKIDPTIINDAKYLKLVNRYTYYVELLDFGDTERFINNYIRPVLTKNFAQILWRMI